MRRPMTLDSRLSMIKVFQNPGTAFQFLDLRKSLWISDVRYAVVPGSNPGFPIELI